MEHINKEKNREFSFGLCFKEQTKEFHNPSKTIVNIFAYVLTLI
jgi:hypothetical protein